MFPTHGDFCLCHGLTGLADFVLAAGEQREWPDVSRLAAETGRFIVDHTISAPAYPCHATPINVAKRLAWSWAP